MDASTAAIVLAAGRGKRMGADVPKVVVPVAGAPMIAHIMETLNRLGFGADEVPGPVVVIGFGAEQVRTAVRQEARFVMQTEQLGTGHAARVGLAAVEPTVRRVLLVHGDEPLIAPTTYSTLLDRQVETNASVVLLTGQVADTKGLGRVVRDPGGKIVSLVQEGELTPEQRKSREINFGAYVFDRDFLEWGLPQLQLHDSGEYYLTDLVQMATTTGRLVEDVPVPHPDQQMGINDREQLERAEKYLRGQTCSDHHRE